MHLWITRDAVDDMSNSRSNTSTDTPLVGKRAD
jgi:hypothetical protein